MDEVWNIRTLPRSSLLAKRSNRRRIVLVTEVIKTLMITLVELHDLIWRWEKLTEGQTSLRHSSNLGHLKLLLSKDTLNSWLEFTKIHPNNSQSMKKIYNSLFVSEGNQAPLITCKIPFQRWSMVAAASCSGGVFQRQGVGKWSEKTETWMQLNTEISLMKTSEPQTGLKVHLSTWQSHSTHSQDNAGVA